jgi:hypothetical protein
VSKPEVHPFRLEELVLPPSTSAKTASPKAGQKPRSQPGPTAAKKSNVYYVKTTKEQLRRLCGATRVVTILVFFHLMFKWFKAYRKPFVLLHDALESEGITRHSQGRALRELVQLRLITVERKNGPRKPPVVAIIGAIKP